MENNNECEQNNDDLPLEYFQRWGKRYQKSKMIYARVRPEEKETILLACEKAGLSMSDFIVGASLEAAECRPSHKNTSQIFDFTVLHCASMKTKPLTFYRLDE